jgi:hypothetical protein
MAARVQEMETPMLSAVARLVELMPPPARDVASIDWDAVTARWGTRMPTDYREFMDIYGAGTVNDSFNIVWPIAPPKRGASMRDFAGNTDAGRWLLDDEPDALAKFEGWIAWAYDVSANHLYWDTSSGEPDRWTVVRLDRGGDWTDSGYGTTEYLAAFLGGDMPVPPAMTLWDPEALVFEPWKLG